MSQIQNISIQLEGIGNVLKSKRFKVPAYQRSYAWEVDHVESLLTDINDAIKNKEKEYFLGSVVVTAGQNNRCDVVDGQQRLTTVSLIISAIKDIFSEDGDTKTSASIESEFLASTDRKTKEKEPKLILNEIDNEVFQELIENIDDVDCASYRRISHIKLINAANFCKKYLKNMCDKSKDSDSDLHELLDYLETNMKIIVVTAPDDSNAFIIFETLNDRGLELAISDLLKNYLFHRSGDKIDETKSRWTTMVSILESASNDPLVVTYLRHFSMAKYGLIRERELFSAIKKRITNKKTALAYSNLLSEGARIYSALINTEHDFWSAYDPVVSKSVSTLNLLGMTQIRPLLLAILDKFDKRDVKTSFKKLVSVAVRFQIVGGVGGGTLENLYANTAKAITEEKITKPSGVISAFKNLPTDALFKAEFSNATISKQKVARYYLRSIEDFLSGEKSELVPSTDTTRVNLEHILPSNPSQDWYKNFTADEIRSYNNRLGNLALMSSRLNGNIGSGSFESKRKFYDESNFILTKEIANETTWNKKSIDIRQSKMADIALKIWSV
jgi:uncharacterized protein with ParB-like and HNH nuclease domain